MRVGAAQDMMAAGMGLLPIMKTGGWKSANVVARYVQEVDILRIANKRFQILVTPLSSDGSGMAESE